VSAVISNWTGLPVFCWTTIDRERIAGPDTSAPIFIFTRSQPRSLLSIAKSKSARSLIRPSRSRKKRIDQICLTFKARFAPTCLPAFQAGLPAAAGSYCEIPITFLHWPVRPIKKRLLSAQRLLTRALKHKKWGNVPDWRLPTHLCHSAPSGKLLKAVVQPFEGGGGSAPRSIGVVHHVAAPCGVRGTACAFSFAVAARLPDRSAPALQNGVSGSRDSDRSSSPQSGASHAAIKASTLAGRR
jgi:hypothetical protein